MKTTADTKYETYIGANGRAYTRKIKNKAHVRLNAAPSSSISFTVASASGVYSPGVWTLFCSARKTEPKAWCIKLLEAFFCDRATKKQMLAMIRGEFTAVENADESITITVKK